MTPAQLRSGVLRVQTAASADLAALFRRVTTAAQALEALSDILPAIIEQYGAAAAVVAAEWYDQARVKAAVPGRFSAEPAEVGDRGVAPLVSWGLAPLLIPRQPDAPAIDERALLRTALVRVDGGMVRRIGDVGRETVMASSVRDPQARGWQRYAVGGCAFCVMVASRGAVYTERTANFASHDNCRCTAAVAFVGEPVPVKPYTPSDRNISDADRARVRAYLAANPAVVG